MKKEIEHKFLVISDEWRSFIIQSIPIKQAYIYTGPPLAVRVRIEPNKCTLNLKKAIIATTRDEYEYQIPDEDAEELMKNYITGYIIEKVRHIVFYKGQRWEIDEFSGANNGLIVAEIELKNEEEKIIIPPWLGKEVSHDKKYLNTSLALLPYSKWQ
ncbi:MAG TPA: CYTH domain-containing protein [Candidatus Hydrogenedens sp.]|nr:CYTH domain-containing protein [Candidatus Hydrogenedens sp.]